ncbi:glycosyltransferase family 2 protein [Bacillus sp. FJAT-45350]|uniref:glycosyltransferase family 2 protein n=1 Tax=Bacillus sp. FJAT-45350 TaxID=2011014 RepID=UPI000BB8DCBA|nr:glycosyltransferase family 2 protein [Bacillus sp. FJAT-45350]
MTKVSIIMTSYNKPKFIGKAIEGILNQTFTDFELLLMDDNSNEETQKIIESYLHDSRIKYFRSNIKSTIERVQKTRYAVLINEALRKVEGEYISYATDDNIYLPKRLEIMVDYLDNNPSIPIVYSSSKTTHVDKNGSTTHQIERKAIVNQWLASCVIDHCSIMHRKGILKEIYIKWGSYWDENPEFYRIGDARFFWRVNHFWPFYPIDEVLDDNYITEESIHHQLVFADEKSEFAKLLPPQRTCKELREDLRRNIRGDNI